eukprot:scaffold12637_cov33-Phaeocystis_antarctica.AAC.1
MCLEHGTPPAILVGAEGRAENQARLWRAHGADALAPQGFARRNLSGAGAPLECVERPSSRRTRPSRPGCRAVEAAQGGERSHCTRRQADTVQKCCDSRVARWAEKLPAGEGVGWTSLGSGDADAISPMRDAKGWRASGA